MNAPTPPVSAAPAAAEPSDPIAPAATVTRTRGLVRRALGWTLIAVLVLGAAFVLTLRAASMPEQRNGNDPESHSASGTRALAEILRAEGVTVDVVRSRDDAQRAIGDDTTLVFSDPAVLSDDAVRDLIANAPDVVITGVSSRTLRLFHLGTADVGASSSGSADCARPELAHVGSVQFTRPLTPSGTATGCFPLTPEGYGVLTADSGTQRITIVEASRLFSNERLAHDGNAALGLALLGQNPHVVWYVPSLEDTDLADNGPTSLGDYTPDWVTPVIVLLLLAGVVAGVWQGRRFGPLVAETLPVTVRASETMIGRARLTARSHDTVHAAQALRDGALRRIGARLSLPSASTPHTLADAAADRLAAPRDSIRMLLAGPLPENESDLVTYARSLQQLEAALEHTAPGLVSGGTAASGSSTTPFVHEAPAASDQIRPTERSTP